MENSVIENTKMLSAGMKLSTLLLSIWFVVSLLVFGLLGWNYLQGTVYDSGVRSGAQTASAQIYTDIINKAANEECNTVFVQFEGRRVDLINVICLQRLQQQLGEQPADAIADPQANQG